MIDDAIFNFKYKLYDNFYPKAFKYIEAIMNSIPEQEEIDSVGSQYSHIMKFGDFLVVKEEQCPDYIFKLRISKVEGKLLSKSLDIYRGYDDLKNKMERRGNFNDKGEVVFKSLEEFKSFMEWEEGLTESSRRKTTLEIIEGNNEALPLISINQFNGNNEPSTSCRCYGSIEDHVRVFGKINSLMAGLDIFSDEFLNDMKDLNKSIESLNIK